MKLRPVTSIAVVLRAVLVLGALLSASSVLGRLLAPALLGAGRRLAAGEVEALPFDVALSAVSAAALLVCWVWGVAVCLVSVVDAVRSAGPSYPPLERRGCPRPVRVAVLALCGVALGTVAAAPAQAGLGGLDLPDRSVGGGRTALPPSPTVRVVTVRPGDSLWSITRRLLPPGADDASVAAAWPRLHLHNRDRIGADPDLIRPGTRLRVPERLSTAPFHGKDRT